MGRAKNAKRVTMTVTGEVFQRLQYWAEKHGVSINQYLSDALDKAIAYENRDYPLPTLEQARLNQLIDRIAALDSNFKSLENVIVSGFESLLTLTKGDSYLMEHDDGEI